MAKQYFIKVTTNAPGNRLCEIVSNYVHIKYNHMIIDAADFDKLKQDVASKIDAAMEECPRCRKPVLSEYKVGIHGDESPRLSLDRSKQDGTAAFVLDTYIIHGTIMYNKKW